MVLLSSFNVENLFERAASMNQATWAEGRPALDWTNQLNKLLNKPHYSEADKAKIVELLTKLGLDKNDDGGKFTRLRQNRGHLVRRSRGKLQVVANGRSDWIGWAELITEPVNAVSTQNTARVMRDVGADVQAVVEADNRIALLRFTLSVFKTISPPAPPFKHVMLIDGNDDRGIDVALMTKPGYEIVRIRSHVDDEDDQGRIFSRDCPEYTVTTPNNNQLVVLVNHLKSKGFGNAADSNERRRRQATRVAQIYNDLISTGEHFVAVVGDFNDFPSSPPLAPLLTGTDLKDISEHPQFDDAGRPGTFGNCARTEKIDYILLSPQLYQRATGGGIFRKGAWGGKHGTLWPHYDTVTNQVEAASDHSAIYANLDI